MFLTYHSPEIKHTGAETTQIIIIVFFIIHLHFDAYQYAELSGEKVLGFV